jgi:Bacterial Ig domain
MKRKAILSVLAGVLLSVAPALAAAPFGWFGGVLGAVDNGGSGIIPVAGWALDDNGIQSVDILVDGAIVGRAFYGMAWQGVAARYPNFPDSALPGFGYFLDTSHYLNGLHTVQPQVRSRAGEVALLEPRTIQFTNNEATLLPFGAIDFPKAQAELRGTCNFDPGAPRRYSVIYGWALDAGVTPQDYGIGYVQLLIDRAVVADSDLDCTFNSVTGGLTQCYGLLRQDIEKQYPSLKDSPHSGFRFVLDIGALVASPGPEFDPPYNQGAHILTIRAGDQANNARNIAEIPVTFSCDCNQSDPRTCNPSNTNENSFGDIDVPRNGLIYSGTMTTTGWALDWDGIKQVFILVDGNFVGTAFFGIPRPDVTDLTFYPGYPNVSAPGWQFSFDTHQFSNGEHSLDVVVLDTRGANIFIGKRRFVIGNDQ